MLFALQLSLVSFLRLEHFSLNRCPTGILYFYFGTELLDQLSSTSFPKWVPHQALSVPNRIEYHSGLTGDILGFKKSFVLVDFLNLNIIQATNGVVPYIRTTNKTVIYWVLLIFYWRWIFTQGLCKKNARTRLFSSQKYVKLSKINDWVKFCAFTKTSSDSGCTRPCVKIKPWARILIVKFCALV